LTLREAPARPERPPRPPAPLIDRIPRELRERPQWVLWKHTLREDGKWAKVPYTSAGPPAKSTDATTWTNFDRVWGCYTSGHDYDGVGYVFAPDDPYVGLDVDHCIDEASTLDAGVRAHVEALSSYTERSQSGRGLHVIVRASKPTGACKREPYEMYDRGRYFALTGDVLEDMPATIEDRTAELAVIHQQIFAEERSKSTATTTIKPASRHDTLVTLAVQRRKNGADVSLINAELADRNNAFAEPKPKAEIAAISTWAVSHVEPDAPHVLELLRLVDFGNDAQNAELFARRCENRLLFNGVDRAWYLYDGRRWIRDLTGAAMRFGKEAANELLRSALEISHEENRQKAIKYAVACASRRKLEAMVDLARSELPATPAEFDCDPFIFNVQNGTLDLRSGILRVHSPKDRLTKITAVPYIEDARAPRWEQFLNEIFQGRRDLIDYVQRLIGYALTGDISEDVLPIAYGRGANGKSVLVRVILALLGDYATPADVGLFLSRREHGPSPEIARLRGVRFVAASEMPEGGRLRENLVKTLTGGDKIAARELYGDVFEYAPTAKFLIATNYKPIVRGDDEGIWRRLKLIPFEAHFEADNRDTHLADKLESELPGILRWAVEGCKRWQCDGLSDPKPVTAAMATYRSDSDAVAAFLADRCVVAPPNEVRASALSAEYKSWCEASNESPVPARTFLAKIRERGCFKERHSNGESVFGGLGLRESRQQC